MSIIKQLDEVTINQIAAGEVIDRPVSIVKELLENAIDAGATHIDIKLEQGGKQSIIISDNGCGISKQDLSKAFLRHATSKISKITDLTGVKTLGFRGEALSSICHVARVEIRSAQENGQGFMMSVYQDQFSDITAVSSSKGTHITVQNLFADLPVRQKFLKSAGTELSHIHDLVLKFILAFPHIDFVLQQQQKSLLNSVGMKDQKVLAIKFFDQLCQDQLFSVNETIADITVNGIVASPQISFSNRQKMIVLVNGRLIQSPVIFKAIQQAYQEQIVPRRFPFLVLNIMLQGDLVDVNIHPQKQDVKFISTGFLYEVLPKVIKVSLQKGSAIHSTSFEPLLGDSVVLESKLDFTLNGAQNVPSMIDEDSPKPLFQTLNTNFSSKPNYQSKDISNSFINNVYQLNHEKADIPFLQVFDTYLIIQSVNGLYILDQHAVHERILYEEFQDVGDQKSDRQGLLVPEIIDCDFTLMEVFNTHQHLLTSFNFIIDIFGSDRLAVREIPVIFSNLNVSELVLTILNDLKEFDTAMYSKRYELKTWIQSKACKAAIKAGKKMTQDELKQLLADFIECPNNFTCPHGRPLYLHFTKSKLERLFLRS